MASLLLPYVLFVYELGRSCQEERWLHKRKREAHSCVLHLDLFPSFINPPPTSLPYVVVLHISRLSHCMCASCLHRGAVLDALRSQCSSDFHSQCTEGCRRATGLLESHAGNPLLGQIHQMQLKKAFLGAAV